MVQDYGTRTITPLSESYEILFRCSFASLIGAGHQVLGLARNDSAIEKLTRMGAEAHKGDISDPESLSTDALASDSVIHTAYNHDFSQMKAAAEADQLAIETLGQALLGTERVQAPCSRVKLERS